MKTLITPSVLLLAMASAHGQPTASPAVRTVAPVAPALAAPSTAPAPRAASPSLRFAQTASSAGVAPAPMTSASRVSYRSSSRSSVPPVVVQFSSAEASQVQDMSEDLDVMTHIIDRALSEDGAEDTRPEKMGIPLYFTGSGRSVRALYLEGFGALFMVKVNFPLQGAPAAKEEEPEKSRDSEWERARREVLGINDPYTGVYGLTSATVEFDQKRVDELKTLLVRALKNASNIRHLKPDDAVSISVFGSLSATVQTTRTKSTDAPGPGASPKPKRTTVSAYGRQLQVSGDNVFITESGSGSGQGSVMTVRAKKSDIDAFAKGDMDQDAFTKKVTFNTYVGAGYGITSVNSWVNEISR